MDRRSVLEGLGCLALASTRVTAFLTSGMRSLDSQTLPAVSIPHEVAGVRIVDSKIAKDATELSREVSPPFLFNHAVRTFLFAALTGKAIQQKYDEEILYLACVLHDLGLTERFAGDLPFEIQGAETAKHFLAEHHYPENRTDIVWDGIAMHCLAIGAYKRPEIALVGEGAGADVLGPDPARITKSQIASVLQAFPRLEFKQAFVKTCADVIRHHPRSAGRTFMRDIAERNVPEFHPSNFCDLVREAPFDQ